MDAPDDPIPTPSPARLRKPAAYVAARDRVRLREEWLALPPEEQQRRLAVQAAHEADVRYGRARERLLALLDDGRLAQALHDAARHMSRRGMRDLRRRSVKDDRDGRHARWLLTMLAKGAAEMQAQERAAEMQDEPEPRVTFRVQQAGEKPRAGAVVVRTRFALPGEKV